jgi:hypothetical protein
MKTVAEIIAFFELTAIWLLIGFRYSALPALIHSPFNGGGDAHGLGPKNQLWLLLALTTLFYLFITALGRLSLPLNLPIGTTEPTIASVRRQIPETLAVLKIGVFSLVLWIALLATQYPPPPHRRLVTVLLPFVVFAIILGFVGRLFLTIRSNEAGHAGTTA